MTVSHSASAAEVDAARLLLDRLGVSAEQLLDATHDDTAVPTFGEYIPQVAAAVSAGTRRVYQSYWNRIQHEWSSRRLHEPSATDIAQLAEQAKTSVVVRANARGGHLAAEHTISALRCLYRHAIADNLLPEHRNTALRVAKPRRLASARRALLDTQLAAINHIATTTGNDRDLDGLLVRLHVETACRRGGALALRPIDLDPEQSLIRLREKGETDRWQPVSPTVMRYLRQHHQHRHQGNTDLRAPLLRYRNGKPITYRRYDHLWARLGEHLPWVAAQQVSTHWLRHTTLTWVERHFGYAVARAYAGHNDRTDFGVTATYVRADLYEVVVALSALTGEVHPLTT
ncbi:tyrosine-type recombinase/integrase [Actinoplanes sp. NPDC051859]|uniref:tyrosine-type recombinase/integrase n=1 Tax=Actinoplanes sp. NPDC051859 TaxID=3363909 RepID=UPI003797D820